jgi:hypothetical protein
MLLTDPQPKDAEADQLIKRARHTMRHFFTFGNNGGLQRGSWLFAIAWNSVIRRTDALSVGSLGSFKQSQAETAAGASAASSDLGRGDPAASYDQADVESAAGGQQLAAGETGCQDPEETTWEAASRNALGASDTSKGAVSSYQPQPEKGPQDQVLSS